MTRPLMTMNKLLTLSESEAMAVEGGTEAVTTSTSAAYDLAYLVGVVVGAIAGAFSAFTAGASDAYSVTEWKTGIVNK